MIRTRIFLQASILCASLASLIPAVEVETDSVTPLSAVVYDQFGKPMAATINWTTTVGTLSSPSGSSVDLTAPSAPANGVVTASSGGLSDTEAITVIASPDEEPVAAIDPVAEVTDSDENGFETVTVTQSSTDDKGITSYEWSIEGTVVGNEASLSYDFPVGATTVSLTVSDEASQSSSDSAVVTVIEPSQDIVLVDVGTIYSNPDS